MSSRPGLQSEFQGSQDCATEKSYLKTKQNRTKKPNNKNKTKKTSYNFKIKSKNTSERSVAMLEGWEDFPIPADLGDSLILLNTPLCFFKHRHYRLGGAELMFFLQYPNSTGLFRLAVFEYLQ